MIRPDMRSRWWMWLFIAIWLVALCSALLVDRHVAQWVHDHHPIDKHSWLVRVVRLPGNYVFLILVSIALVLFHPKTWQAAVPLLLSGPVVGLAYLTLKWIFGRQRPVIVIAPFTLHPFIHGIVGLFRSVSGLSFPSGDATMAFAAAGCLTAVLPRWKVFFLLAAFLVAIERVMENAHYVSDVVAGAGLGWACAILSIALARKLLNRSAPSADVLPRDEEIRTCARES